MEQHCKTQRERGPEEAKCPSQTKQEGAGETPDKGARSSDMLSEAVRISEDDLDGHLRSLLRKGIQASAATRLRHHLQEPKAKRETQKGSHNWPVSYTCNQYNALKQRAV